MKKLPIALMLCLVGSSADIFAQQHQKANIQHVTVFLSGAEIENTAKVSLPAGGGDVIFTNIAGDVDEETINVGTDNTNVVIQSVSFQKNYLDDDQISPRMQSYKDSITMLTAQKQMAGNRLAVVNQQLDILNANKVVSGANTGLNIAEMQKMLDLVNTKMGMYLEERAAQQERIKKADEHIAKLNKQIEQEKGKSQGQLIVKFYTKQATEAKVGLAYVANDASWEPSYDLRTDKLGSPVDLSYKAAVQQNTGVKWDNVKLTISTGNPSEGATAPEFYPGYLAFYVPEIVKMMDYKKSTPTSNSSVHIGGARNEDTGYIIDGVEIKSVTKSDEIVRIKTEIATTYDVELPYTIASDGIEHMAVINNSKVPAQYHYYSYPRADHDAFLQAQITKWEELNLLPGNVNIFYQGTYVGHSYLDVRNVKDTLTFSLGRDKKIVVRRAQDTKYRSTRTIGSNVKEQYGYTITVRNTHNQPVDIVIADQVPVTTDKDISVEDIETSGGKYNETTGEVNWRLSLNASEAKELKLAYTIKYPKGKTLNGH